MTKASDSSETAGKLLAAGMKLFGERGFKATTTRMIADQANSNIGSIAYYFGNKRNLYRAILTHISERMQDKFRLYDIERRDHTFRSPEQARGSLKEIVRLLVRTFASEGEVGQWLLLVMREQADPSDCYDLLYEGVFDRVYTILGVRIAYLMEKSVDDVDVVIECHTLIGQIVFFLVGRHPLLRRLKRESGFDERLLESVEQTVFSHLEHYRPPT
ncbi:CerR family C-terminal domain-containing protein [Marinimicrobium locisalis]|uniref:CerR family C-terminal domain-containing protein n=1 Tax=Marinimicrobium locisalis TaxID=546022 RepID=UPI0032215441